jgi:hypothetical protein
MAKAASRPSMQRSRTSSPDPILKLIKEADIRLADLRRAAEERAAIIGKIGKNTVGGSDLGRAPIEGPLTFHRLFYTYTFDGLGPFMKACRRAASQAKTVIKGEKSSLKSGRLNAHQELIARQNILEAQATLAQLPLIEAWGQREWRREARPARPTPPHQRLPQGQRALFRGVLRRSERGHQGFGGETQDCRGLPGADQACGRPAHVRQRFGR